LISATGIAERMQTMLFSATMSANVKTLASLSLNNPADVRTEALYSTAGGLRQQFVRLKKGHDTPLSREAVLLALCTRSFKTKTIGEQIANTIAHSNTHV
jgi:ATP-dependent RNA helicase DDX27